MVELKTPVLNKMLAEFNQSVGLHCFTEIAEQLGISESEIDAYENWINSAALGHESCHRAWLIGLITGWALARQKVN